MYNRYLPSGNGQHRRQTVPDRPKPQTVSASDVSFSAQQAEFARPNSPQNAESRRTNAQRDSQRPSGQQNSEQQRPPTPRNSDTHSPSAQRPAEQCRAAPATADAPPQFHLPFLDRLNLDSGDLLLLAVMLLLLSEGNEDSASVILTLAIFLFLQ